MKRRTCIVGTAVAAASLAVGVGISVAASASKPATPVIVKPIVLRCTVSLTTEPPQGSDTVAAPDQGNQYGPTHCPKRLLIPAVKGTSAVKGTPAVKGFGRGIEGDTFTIPDSGDTVGTYTQYFGDGTVSGVFDLTPGEGSTSGDVVNFGGQTWAGTVTVTGGTGVYKGIEDFRPLKKGKAGKAGKRGKKTIGTLTCTSPDNVHMTCQEKVKLMMPATVTG